MWGKELHRDPGGAREREDVVRGTILVIQDCFEALQTTGAAGPDQGAD